VFTYEKGDIADDTLNSEEAQVKQRLHFFVGLSDGSVFVPGINFRTAYDSA